MPTPLAARMPRLNWLSLTPSSAAFWNQRAAESLSAVPSAPIANSTARLCMALALPCSAAIWYQVLALAMSRSTPRPFS